MFVAVALFVRLGGLYRKLIWISDCYSRPTKEAKCIFKESLTRQGRLSFTRKHEK